MDALRGHMEPHGYLRHLFGLMVLKLLSDESESATCPALTSFTVPPLAQWPLLVAAPEELGPRLAEACSLVEESNPSLRGVLTRIDFTGASLGLPEQRDRLLWQLVKSISRLPKLSGEVLSSGQLGQVGDAFLFRVAEAAGRRGAAYVTPPSIIDLLVELLELQPGMSVCDPACGAGSLLAACARRIARGTHPSCEEAASGEWALHGQEKNLDAWSLCRMNLLLHGLFNTRIEPGDVLRSPRLVEAGRLLRYERVVVDPPFNLDRWGAESAGEDPFHRFEPIPPKHLGNYAFVQHCLATLVEGGLAAILAPSGVLFRSGAEAQIRQGLVEADHFEAIIGLPGNLLYETAIPAIVLMMRRGKPASRRGKVLFVDASRLGMSQGRQRVLLPQDIQSIARAFREFKGEEGFSRVVSLEEIGRNGWNLNIASYVGHAPIAARVALHEQLEELAVAERQRDEAARRMDALMDAFRRSYLDGNG
jgi:type I restriction enzyme M protein